MKKKYFIPLAGIKMREDEEKSASFMHLIQVKYEVKKNEYLCSFIFMARKDLLLVAEFINK